MKPSFSNFLAKYNFNWLESNFYHFHCVPPLISDKVKDLKKINHKIDIIEELISENNEYVQDSYKITTWYCDLYHRLCCCLKKNS